MYQQISLIGNLGNDPEMRYTATGVPVTSFRMAVSKSWAGQDGQQQEKVTWFRVTAWNKLAETVSQYLSKGRQVLVVGEVEEAKAYVDKMGDLKATIEIRANTVRFLGQKGESQPAAPSETTPQKEAAGDGYTDEDLPF